MTPVRSHYRRATQTLGNSPTAGLDSLCLLQHVLAVDRSELFRKFDDPLTAQQSRLFDDLLERRCRQEPIAYLVGEQEFYGYKFYVDRRVLIPRPTSEQLIDVALEVLPVNGRLLDVGCGSGCLAITLALLRPALLTIEAWDVSDPALAVARRNIVLHHCQQIELRMHDIFTVSYDKQRKFDLLISNPPYVHRHEQLPLSVSNFEPAQALYSRGNNLPFYRQLATIGNNVLLTTGSIVVEINPVDLSKVVSIFVSQGYRLGGQYRDLQGLSRTLLFNKGSADG